MPAGCLHDLDGRWDAPTALACIVPPLVDALQAFAHRGFAPLMQQFAARDALAGRCVRLSDGREGMADGVGQDGALHVRAATGVFEVSTSEVSVRPVLSASRP